MSTAIQEALGKFTVGEFNNPLDKLKQKLEGIFISPSRYLSVPEEKFAELCRLADNEFSELLDSIAEADKFQITIIDDFLTKARRFDDTGNLAQNFIEKFQNYLSSEFQLWLKFCFESAKGYALINQGFYLLLKGEAENELESKLKNYFDGFEKFSEAIEAYINVFSPDLCNQIALLAKSMLETESKIEFHRFKGNINSLDFYRKLLRRVVKSILWDLDQLRNVSTKQAVETNGSESNNSTQLQKLLILSIQETEKMMHRGIDISDPLILTPLEEIADKYPEIAEQCNEFLSALLQKQIYSPLPSVITQAISDGF